MEEWNNGGMENKGNYGKTKIKKMENKDKYLRYDIMEEWRIKVILTLVPSNMKQKLHWKVPLQEYYMLEQVPNKTLMKGRGFLSEAPPLIVATTPSSPPLILEQY